ncbi:MAG: hypothetical protein FJ125_18415, partial [Deltaproteobacteria bacterium]|nr:hypothetical protein [Deltaproteobacteria bacterium]
MDENADARWRIPLEEAGHLVSTVREEGLRGTDDQTLISICQGLGLCLITADLDFAQRLLYPPERYAGIIVLRHPRPTLSAMQSLVGQIARALQHEHPTGRLWIVE